MDFDINKYDKIKFDEKDLTHKRIKALLLWFEYDVYKKKIPVEKQIPKMDDYLITLLKEEMYEVLPFFKNLREDMIKRFEEGETDIIAVVPPRIKPKIEKPVIVAEEITVEPYLTTIKNKIIKWFRLTFNK